jgi:hypothetical protein
MDCSSFDRWLDEGRPAELGSKATAHAARCPACACALDASERIESALAQRFATAPDRFADRVLAQLPVEDPRPADLGAFDLEPALPWWVRIFREPATVLAFLLAAVLIAWGPKLWRQLSEALAENGGLLSGQWAPDLSAASGFMVQPAMLFILLATGWLLFRAFLTLGSPSPRRQ